MRERDVFDPCPTCGRWMTVQVTPPNQDRPFSAVTVRCFPCDTVEPVSYRLAHDPIPAAFTTASAAPC